LVAPDIAEAEEYPDMSVIRPDFEALQDARAGNMRVRVMLVTSGSEIQAATALDISEYLEFGYDPTPITFTDAEGEAPELDAAIYLENGDAMRETPEEAIARINRELEAWEDMSTAARWTPELEDEAELPSTDLGSVPFTRFDPPSPDAGDWLERVCDDLRLTEWQRTMLEQYYAWPLVPTRVLPSTDG
jgi:hypothetical protein